MHTRPVNIQPDEPIACSLDGGALDQRRRDWAGVLSEATVASREDLRVELHIPVDAGRLARVQQLVAAERDCCGFLQWQLTDANGHVLLTVSGPPGSEAILAEFSTIPSV